MNLSEISNETANPVVPDIRIQKHPKSKKIKIIYYVVFLLILGFGFIGNPHINISDGGMVINRNSELYGTYYPASESKYIKWYFLTFYYEGEGWKHNYLHDLGYSDDKTYWGEVTEFYGGEIAVFAVLNSLIALAPAAYELIRKKECKNTELNIRDDKIYGSSGIGFVKHKYDIPFNSVNEVSLSNSKIDKIKSGKTLKILYSNKKAAFSYIQNAEEVKNYIEQSMSSFNGKKVENVSAVIQNESSADELLKFKQLLDMGAITQEDFDRKKKEILNT